MRAKVVDALALLLRRSRKRPQQRLRNAELSKHYYFW
jgi:hypothetical protein